MYDDVDWPLYLSEAKAMSGYNWVHDSIKDQVTFIKRHNDHPSQIVLGDKARLDLMRWLTVTEVLSSSDPVRELLSLDGPVIPRGFYFGMELVAPEGVDPWTVLVRV